MGINERLEMLGRERTSEQKLTRSPLGTETRAAVLSVLEEDELYSLKQLKANLDAVNSVKKEDAKRILFALEKLVSTAHEDSLLNVATFEKLGFSLPVAQVLVAIAQGEATLIDLDKVWE